MRRRRALVFGLLPPGLLLPPAAAVARAEPRSSAEFRRPLGREREDVVGASNRRRRIRVASQAVTRAVRGEGRVGGLAEVGRRRGSICFFSCSL